MQAVKQLLDSRLELKVADVATSGFATDTGNVVTITQAIIEGDGADQRTGRQIDLKHIQWRIMLYLPSTNVHAAVRIVWFLDTQANGIVPAVTDVLTSAVVTSYYNGTNLQSKRFRILHDATYPLVNTASNMQRFIQHDHKLNTIITYGASTSVAAANRKNALYALVISDAPANQPSFSLNAGIRFTDA
jgi:hypothetical protein